jgi:hypothetical protein
MSSSSTARWTAYSGFTFVAIMLANVFGSPSSGETSDTGQQVIARVSAHVTGIEVWNWLAGLAAVALLAFAAGLTAMHDDTESGHSPLGRLAFGGAVCLVSVAVVQHAVTATLAHLVGAGQASAQTASILNQASMVVESLVRIGLAVFVGASCLAVTRLSRWAVALGAVAAVANLLSSGAVGTRGLLQAGGPLPGIGLLLFVVWTVTVSTRLLRPRTEAVPVSSLDAAPARTTFA